MATEDVSAEVDEEIEALQAIFGHDFVMGKEIWGQRTFKLRVAPHSEMSAKSYVSVVVEFVLRGGYPSEMCVRVQPTCSFRAWAGMGAQRGAPSRAAGLA